MMFKDYKVVITGATSGMGLEAAKRFIAEGATVIAIGRNFEKVGDLGKQYIPCKCDVGDEKQIEQACQFINETFNGELDIFINNAGAGSYNVGCTDITFSAFDKSMHLLLAAPMVFAKLLYPMLLKAPHGDPNIINIASAYGHAIKSKDVIYTLAKRALIHYTREEAITFIGIRCNCISPGVINTPIFESDGTNLPREVVDGFFKSIEETIPLGRVGTPTDIVEAMLFIASKDAQYINGSEWLIDGGYMTVYSGE